MIEPIKEMPYSTRIISQPLRFSVSFFENHHISNLKLWWVQDLGNPQNWAILLVESKILNPRSFTLWFGSKPSMQQWSGANVASISCQILATIPKEILLEVQEVSLQAWFYCLLRKQGWWRSDLWFGPQVSWTTTLILTHPYLVVFVVCFPILLRFAKLKLMCVPNTLNPNYNLRLTPKLDEIDSNSFIYINPPPPPLIIMTISSKMVNKLWTHIQSLLNKFLCGACFLTCT